MGERHYKSAYDYNYNLDYPHYTDEPAFWLRTPSAETVRQGAAYKGAATMTQEELDTGEDVFVVKWSKDPSEYLVPGGTEFIKETNCYELMHTPLMRSEFIDDVDSLCGNPCYGTVARTMAQLLNGECFGSGGSMAEGSARQAAGSYALACQQKKDSSSYCIELMGHAVKSCSQMKSNLGCCYASMSSWMKLGSDETVEKWADYTYNCAVNQDLCTCPGKQGVFRRFEVDEETAEINDVGVGGFDDMCRASTVSLPHFAAVSLAAALAVMNAWVF